MVRMNEPRPEIAAVQEVLDQLGDRLAPHWIQTADELLRNGEPNEALIQIAWGIATDRLEVPRPTLLWIRETVGDPRDLPPNMK